jgi:ABC-type Zn uptake system ZnuABC Zn-binding protein ZnuA
MAKINFKFILVLTLSLMIVSVFSQLNGNAYASTETNNSGERPKIVTYMSITEDWTRQLLRNVEADIHVLVSGTEDIHSYDPSSDATLMMDGADLFVRLNIPIEAYADQISSQFPSVPTADLWVNITEDPQWGYNPRKDPVWQHPANPPNMHMWTSPSIARNFIHRLAQRLKETIGTTEIINETIDANLKGYDLQLINTIDWLTKLSKTPEYQALKLVPFHPAFIYYLEDDLDMERVAVIEEKPGVEVSLTHLEYLREKINDSCTIVWHPQESIGQEYARDLSMETGAEMTMITPLIPIQTPSEWEPKFGSHIDTFLEMVEFNTYQLVNGAPYQGESGEESIPGFEMLLMILSIFGVSSIITIKWKKRYNTN